MKKTVVKNIMSFSKFKPLSIAEIILLRAHRQGQWAKIGIDPIVSDLKCANKYSLFRVRCPNQKTRNNTVRAEFLRCLVLSSEDDKELNSNAIKLAGAWITGDVEFDGSKIVKGLWFYRCYFDSPLSLVGSHLYGSLGLRGCSVADVRCSGLVCERDVFLNKNLVARKFVDFGGASINGRFLCENATFQGRSANGVALNFDGVSVKGEVRAINSKFENGSFLVTHSNIFGDFDCSLAVFRGRDAYGSALFADNSCIGGNFFCEGGIFDSGAVRFANVKVLGSFELRGAKLLGVDEDGDSLIADGISVSRNLFLDKYFFSIGCARFHGAEIKSNFECSKSYFLSEDIGLLFDSSVIHGDVSLTDSFQAEGLISFVGTKIFGDFVCEKSAFENFNSDVSLTLKRSLVEGSVILKSNYFAEAGADFEGARIYHDFVCTDSEINATEGRCSLKLHGIEIRGDFVFKNMKGARFVSLESASVGSLNDDLESWGEGIVLDGFVYSRIGSGSPVGFKERLGWLYKQRRCDVGKASRGENSFKPQPWRQMLNVLEEMGHRESSKLLGVEFEKLMRRCNCFTGGEEFSVLKISCFFPWIISLCFGALAGFGYKPLRLMYWTVFVWLICSVWYWYAAMCAVFAPTNPLVFQNEKYVQCQGLNEDLNDETFFKKIKYNNNWFYCESLEEEYASFSPLAYSADLIMPVVDLQQQDSWAPKIPTPKMDVVKELFVFDMKHVTRLVVWFEILFGWLSGLMLAAMLTGVTQRGRS